MLLQVSIHITAVGNSYVDSLIASIKNGQNVRGAPQHCCEWGRMASNEAKLPF